MCLNVLSSSFFPLSILRHFEGEHARLGKGASINYVMGVDP